MLFNSFAYFKGYIEEKNIAAGTGSEYRPIKVKIPHPNVDLEFGDYQIFDYRVKSGDTFLKILLNLGTSDADIVSILDALKKVYNPRAIVNNQHIRIKYKVMIDYQKAEEEVSSENITRNVLIQQITVTPAVDREIVISREKDGSYKAKEAKKQLSKQIIKSSGTITSGLFLDGMEAGVSGNVMMNMVNLFSFDVDFQRDIHEGDKFEVIYEAYYDKEGNKIKDGDILFASLNLQKRAIDIYRFVIDGSAEYFDAKGNSTRKSLLRTPINGARISSGFGMRRHPILGYSKMHKGLDFAAKTGTPILAAGNGVLVHYSRKGGYGNYVKIKHNSEFSTAYGHASRFVKGLRVGSKVKQGQVVAYVGTTGRSTGPHLHYEVWKNNVAINPRSVKTTSGIRLSGKRLSKFNAVKAEIENYRRNIPNQNSKLQ